MDTSVLPRCYLAFIFQILGYCSSVWGSAAECHLQLFERQVYSVVRLCPDQSFLSLCHRHNGAGLSMLSKVNSNFNHCLFSELPYASTKVRHTRAVIAAHPLEFEVSRCRTSQFARCFLHRPRFDCGMTFPTLCLTLERWMSSRVQSTVGCFHELCFRQLSVARVLVGLRPQFINNFVFLT